MHAAEPLPLILTLRLDAQSMGVLDQLRQRHFPPERNHLKAHVTMFHKLPGEARQSIEADLAEVAGAYPPFAVRVPGPRSLGRGVALRLEANDALQVRKDLAKRWQAMLEPQDAQGFNPHVTVQNKVTPEEAHRLLAELSHGFQPFEAQAEGMDLWEYRGGPWGYLRGFDFAG